MSYTIAICWNAPRSSATATAAKNLLRRSLEHFLSAAEVIVPLLEPNSYTSHHAKAVINSKTPLPVSAARSRMICRRNGFQSASRTVNWQELCAMACACRSGGLLGNTRFGGGSHRRVAGGSAFFLKFAKLAPPFCMLTLTKYTVN
jgi:hypothetical protein